MLMLAILSSLPVLAQDGADKHVTPDSVQSQITQKPEVYEGNVPKETPVIYGKPFVVPTLRFRLLKGDTNEPLTGAKVHVLYVWNWLQYPYPESSCGAFIPATELAEVESDKDGNVTFPEYTVKPRGWTRLPECRKKAEPYFDSLEIRIGHPQYAAGFIYSKSDIEHHRDKVNVVNVPIKRLRNGYGKLIDKVTGKPIP